jgi:DegV family protein with EDD domain
MDDFTIVTDSSCDLPASCAEKLGLTVLPLSFTIGGKEYRNYLDGHEFSIHQLYTELRAGHMAKTAAVNADAFTGAIEPLLKKGKDVLTAAFSSGLSGTCSAARVACRELAEKYPERKVFCVDTLAASLGQGMLVYYAALRQKAGKGIAEVRDWLEDNKLKMCHWFTVDDLGFLRRGGRISAATALFGGMLNIKPVMHMDDSGHLAAVGKVRGRRAALNALLDKMAQTAIEPENQTVFVSHGDAPEDAEYIALEVKRRFGVKNIIINSVGPVIGAHSGPGTIALFFFGTQR